MQPATQTAPVSRSGLWIARVLDGIAFLFLLFDSVIHLMVIAPGLAIRFRRMLVLVCFPNSHTCGHPPDA